MKKYQVSLNYEGFADNEAVILEMARAHICVREAKQQILTAFTVHQILVREDIAAAEQEHFVVFMLNTQMDIIDRQTVTKGTLNSSLIHPREVFKEAIRLNSACILIAHNHPSGGLEASAEDIAVTKRIREAGTLLGIELVDHVIVTQAGYHSMKESNEL